MSSPIDITDIELARQQWHTLKLGFDALDPTPQSLHGFAAQARAAASLHKVLPHNYEVVLLDLLNRLESSALFDEESCSFSHDDLIANLRTWLDKAGAQLDKLPTHGH